MSALTLADARIHLNISVSTYDAELQTVIDAAEAVISKRVGALGSVSTVSTVDGNTGVLILPNLPLISVQSVMAVGDSTPVNASGYTIDTAGLIYGGFYGTRYTVAYTHGRTVTPDLLFAVKEMTRHLWSTQRGTGAKPGADAGSVPGYLMPYAVASLIEPYLLPGVA